MTHRRQIRDDVGMNLFPFLAVLICTMGALIMLLVVMVQQARVKANTPPTVVAQHATESADQHAAEPVLEPSDKDESAPTPEAAAEELVDSPADKPASDPATDADEIAEQNTDAESSEDEPPALAAADDSTGLPEHDNPFLVPIPELELAEAGTDARAEADELAENTSAEQQQLEEALRARRELADQRQQELEMAQWKTEMLREAYTKTAEDVQQQRLVLAHLEDHTRKLLQQAERMQQEADMIAQLAQQETDSEQQTADQLRALAEQADELRQQVEQEQRQLQQRKPSYSLVPYDGPHGTRRRPIYIECFPERVVLQPEGVELLGEDFRAPLNTDNPLAVALRAKREYLHRQGLLPEDQEPYPLLIVRPDAASSYAAARSAMSAWESEYGYELVESELELDYRDPDPGLRQHLADVVEDAREKRRVLFAMAARRQSRQRQREVLRPSAGGGFESVAGRGSRGNGAVSLNSAGNNNGRNPAGQDTTSRYGRGGNGVSDNSAGSRSTSGYTRAGTSGRSNSALAAGGTNPMRGPIHRGVGPGGNQGRRPAGPYVANNGGSNRAGANQNGSGGTGSRWDVGSASAAAQATNGMAQNGRPSSAENPFGRLDDNFADPTPPNGQYASAGRGDSGAGYAGAGNGAGAGQERGQGVGQGDGRGSDARAGRQQGNDNGRYAGAAEAQRSGVQSAVAGRPGAGGTSATATGSGGRGNGGSGGASSGTARSGQASPAKGQMQSFGSSSSLADSRGANWALPTLPDRDVGIRRPIRCVCEPHQLTLLPEPGTAQKKVVLPFRGSVGQVIDPFVEAVQQRLQSWGIAGRGIYWQPSLQIEVRQQADTSYQHLLQLLDNSGLEVTRQP